MGQRISGYKSSTASEPVHNMCTPSIQADALEVAARKLMKGGANSAGLATSPRPNTTFSMRPVVKADFRDYWEKSRQPLHCACWKCRGCKVYKSEGNIRFREAVAYLDCILEEFTICVRQNRKFSERGVAFSGRLDLHPSVLPSRAAGKDEYPPSSVGALSIQSPPCIDVELMSEWATQGAAIPTWGCVSIGERTLQELHLCHQSYGDTNVCTCGRCMFILSLTLFLNSP